MYNPGIPVSVGSYAEVANSTIHLVFVDQDIQTGEKFCAMDVTLPWGTFDNSFGGTIGDIITRSITDGFYAIKILDISTSNQTATLQVLSYARSNVANIWINHNLPSMATPGSTVNYDFELTNNSVPSVQIRWLLASKIGSQGDYPRGDNELALPPVAYKDIGCWYNDWAIGGTCANGQTIMGNGGHGHISGSFTASSNINNYENVTLRIFVYVSNYWPGTGKHEYVETTMTGQDILISQCAGKVCDPTYTCQGCDAYPLICNPTDPIGPCIPGTPPITNDPRCTSNGYIYISSTPSGATILVDGYQIETTGSIPVIVGLAVSGNPHSVELRLAGYETWIDNNVNVSCTAPVIISQVLTPPAPYELHLKLGSATLASYVLSTINKFTDIFGNALSIMVPGIIINSVTYVEVDHEIVIEMQSSSLGMYYQSLYPNNLYYYQNNLNLNNYPNVQTLIGPLLLILLPAIPALIVVILLWLGYDIPFFSFRKKAIPLNTEVHITARLAISESTFVNPPEEVTIKFNGETKPANAVNSYTATFSNVKATTDTTYPVEAYIPISSGSSVYKAEYKGNILVLPPRTDETVTLKINQSQERDYAPPCPLKYPDSTQVPLGTIIKIMHILKNENGVTEIKEYGIRTVKADGCIDPVKVPTVLTNNMLDYQVIPKDVDPNSPDSTPVPGDTDTIKRYIDVKNKIAVFTYSTLNNDITVDKIEIKNLGTNTIIKTISGTDIKSGYNEIDGIPSGTYQAIITKSGYDIYSCSSSCTVEFTAEYLQSVSFIVILQALVTTCDISIYVLDKDGKEIKTIPSIKMCKGTVCQDYTIAIGNKLELKEVTEGSYKFTLTADKYGAITDQTKNISCTDPQLIFRMDPTGEDIIPATMELTVNDLKGSISVAKNTSFTVKTTGANPTETVEIRNISTTPDTLLASGAAGEGGVYETSLYFDTDTTFDLQALQGCGVLVCAKNSNIIDLKIGAGAEECIVPNPLGGCLVTKETAVGIGTFLLAALFGVAALGMIIMRAPAGGERVIVTTPPRYPGGPQETRITEKTQTVLGKATEKGIETLGTVAMVTK